MNNQMAEGRRRAWGRCAGALEGLPPTCRLLVGDAAFRGRLHGPHVLEERSPGGL
jgi:hypothetical protein